MAKTKKKVNKKDAVVSEGTNDLNGIVKKRKQEPDRETKPVPKVTVEMLLNTILDAKVNKRKDEFVKFIEGNCYVRDISCGVQITEKLHGAPKKVFGRIENQKNFDEN